MPVNTAKTNHRPLTREQIINYLNNYHNYCEEINEAEQAKRFIPAPATARYGIEATLPRGNSGGHSDPTFTQAVIKRADTYIERRIRAIEEVDRRKFYVFSVRENDVLDLWLQGLNNVQIAKEMDVSERTIRRYKTNIIEAMVNIV